MVQQGEFVSVKMSSNGPARWVCLCKGVIEWSNKVSLSLQRFHRIVQQGEFVSAKVSSNGPAR